MKALGVAIGVFAAAYAVACGGLVVPNEDPDPAPSPSPSASSSASTGTCIPGDEPADRVCVPGVAIANLPITVDLDEQTCLRCGESVSACDVDVTGTTVTLTMATLTCSATYTGSEGCGAACWPKTTCTIPPLDAGTYTLTIADAASAFEPRELVVADDGTSSSCALPAHGVPIPPLDGTKYDASCTTDDDCVSVNGGDVCGKCSCGGLAINVADQERAEADGRALASQCEPFTGIPCFCPAFRVACNIAPDATTGTCEVGAP